MNSIKPSRKVKGNRNFHLRPSALMELLIKLLAIRLGHYKTMPKPLVIAVAYCFALNAQANPLGEIVVNGQASFATSGNTLTITNSPNAIINWQGFSINSGETTRFIQQSASSSVLNRVLGADPSVLLGTLTSNGKVFLINPNGILVGQGARIDVAGFVASTLNLSNSDFLAGKLNFDATPNAGAIQNSGSITTPEGGTVYLIAPQIENQGIITTPGGETILAAGNTVQFVDTGTPGVTVQVTGTDNNATNLGQILADSGRIGMVGATLKNSGILSASSLVNEGGRVFLKATNRVEAGGTITANGTRGGTIEVLGNEVGVMDGATLSANGTQGGGTVLVGGDYQGKNPAVQNAQVTYFAPTATISADATDYGNGGKVIVWADDTTRAYGSISARGGIYGGNGGFVETSGRHFLDVTRAPDIAAPLGNGGAWLLDPENITISSAGSSNITGVTPFQPVTTGISILSDAVLRAALVSGGTVIVDTTGGTGTTGNILVDITANLTGISAGASAILYLNAHNDITIDSSITATGAPIEMHFTADQDSNGSGAVFINAALDSNGGNVNVSSFGDILLNAGSNNITAGAGTVHLASTGGSIQGDAMGAPLDISAASVVLDAANGISANGGSAQFYVDAGSISFSNSGSGLVRIYNNHAGASSFTGYNTGGSVNLESFDSANPTSVGNVSAGGDIVFRMNNINITGLVDANAGANTVFLAPFTAASQVSVNGAATFDLTSTELSNITAGKIVIGNDSFGNTALTTTIAGTTTITAADLEIWGGTISMTGANISTLLGNIDLIAGAALSITDAQVISGGNMNIQVGGNLTLAATITQSMLKSGGTQTINFTGSGVSHQMNIFGGNTSTVGGASASIESSGLQTIAYATTGGSTLDILVAGGSAVDNTRNAEIWVNNAPTGNFICYSCATWNWASIQSYGGQTISASTITVNGGAGASNAVAGNGNWASIQNKSASVGQTITTTGAISLKGGTAPGFYNPTYPNESLSNEADIHSDGMQTINAGSINMLGGGDANTLGGAFLTGKAGQDITTATTLAMTGGASTIGGQYGLGAPAIIGEEFSANITLTVGGNLTMIGGAGGTASPALIGSAQGIPYISITAAAVDMTLGAGIGVLTGGSAGTLSMTATAGNISQDTSSYINTDSLSAFAYAGLINLAGPNLVNTVIDLYASGTIGYVSAQTVHIGSAISTTGSVTIISTLGDIGLGVLDATGAATVTADGAIYDDNGSGVNNITASNIYLTSNSGGLPGQLAISADTQVAAGGAITADVIAGSDGGIRIYNAGATTAATNAPGSVSLTDTSTNGGTITFIHDGDMGATSISASTNGGDIAILVNGTLTGGGNMTINTPNSALIGATGDMSITSSITNSLGSLGLAAVNLLDISGSVSAAGDLVLAASNITITNGSVTAGGNASVYAAGDISINATGSASITAANDVFLTLGGPTSTLYFNDLATSTGYTGSATVVSNNSNLLSNIYVDFLGRSSGGVLIDGVETLTTTGSSGFFYAGQPAVSGTNLIVTYFQDLSQILFALTPPPPATTTDLPTSDQLTAPFVAIIETSSGGGAGTFDLSGGGIGGTSDTFGGDESTSSTAGNGDAKKDDSNKDDAAGNSKGNGKDDKDQGKKDEKPGKC